MDIRTFVNAISPCLNHLLIEPAFDTDDGLDFGWFCREHSIATKLVAEQHGFKCDIIRGHVSAYVAGKQRLTTTGTDTDHVWCSINGTTPCDLSMSFRYFDGYPQLDSAIVGCENNGSFIVSHVPSAFDFPDALDNKTNAIYFAPTVTLNHTPHDYISDPTILVTTAEAGQITLAVAAYLLALIGGREKSLEHLTQSNALQTIMSNYQNASQRLG